MRIQFFISFLLIGVAVKAQQIRVGVNLYDDNFSGSHAATSYMVNDSTIIDADYVSEPVFQVFVE